MANERRNERVRLMGNWCNAGSIAIITLGTLAPVLASVYDWFNVVTPAKPMVTNWPLPVAAFLVGIFMHVLGQAVLEGIIEQGAINDDE
jgi:hypothetical protein